jgi:DNA polymerase-3 subunit alpha
MAKAPFVSLHNHTQIGSPLDGMNDVDQLFSQAASLDHRAIAITDHGTMTAHYDCYKASLNTGVKFIPGMEAYFAADLESKKSNHLVLLAKNEVGYRNILRLNYESYHNQVSGFMGKKTPRIGWDLLGRFNEGVICLTACSNGPIAKALIAEKNEEEAIARLARLHSIFGDRLFLELQPHALKTDDGNVDQVLLNQRLIEFGRNMGINYTITCDAHYLDKDHAKYHDMMLAIKDKKPVDDPNRFRYGVQDMYLKSHEEVIDFFGSNIAEEGMKNSVMISDMCEEPSYLKPKDPILPKFPINEEPDFEEFKSWHEKNDEGTPIDKSFLRYKCMQNFKDKFSDMDSKTKREYWDRVKYELSILEARNFSSYMLIVADYINWAKNNDVPVGPARGSAAGSLVAFLTGITTVDPIKFGLLFERFHNKEKKSFPDIDTDFCKNKRHLVGEYLKEKYGHDRVANISNWSTITPKVAVKDVARSLNIGGDKSSAFKIANAITSIMPDTKTLEEAYETSPEFKKYMDKYPELYEYGRKLQGLTRNWSTHAAGYVIGDRPLYELVPVRIDSDGTLATQWEKTRTEDNGLIKMDVLGLNTLTQINEVLEFIKERHGVEIKMDDIPLDDKQTFKNISEGKNIGVFQLESTLNPLCQKIKPTSVQMVSDINALGRPSCSAEDRKNYIRRRFGLDEIKYRHESLKGALKSTFGVSLYEEGMMKIAKDCAGWDLNQADALRKITKLKGKDKDLVLRTETNFIKDSMDISGMTYKKAKEVWDYEIMPFGEYGFNFSHSVAYSHISVYTAWLKTNYPVEFMCGLLNSENPNSDKSQVYVAECEEMEIRIYPPDINISKSGYRVSDSGSIFSGFSCVKGLGEKAINNILENQPFSCLHDFLSRIDSRKVNKTSIQALAKAGAFDNMGIPRKTVFDNYAKIRTKAKKYLEKHGNFEGIAEIEGDEWDRSDLLIFEREALGRTISGNLSEAYEGFFTSNSFITKLSEVPDLTKNRSVKIEAIIKNKIKEFKIKKGQNVGRKFAKYLIEDKWGSTCELTVWTEDYEKYGNKLIDGIPFKAVCSVSEYMGTKDLALKKLERVFKN